MATIRAEEVRVGMRGQVRNMTSYLYTCEGITCYSHVLLNTIIVVTAVISVLGIIGNIVSLLAIFSNRRAITTNSIMIAQLNAVDGAYCLLVLPIQVLLLIRKENFLDDIACQVHGALRFLLSVADILFISSIALYRLLLVVYTDNFYILSRFPWLHVCCTMCYALPVFFLVVPITRLRLQLKFETRVLMCTDAEDNDLFEKVIVLIATVLLPLCLVWTSYIRIALYVSDQRKSQGLLSKQRDARARKQSLRLTSVIVITIVCFTFGTLPIFVFPLLDPKHRFVVSRMWANLASWSTYMLNPIIYSLMDVRFQNTCFKLVQFRKKIFRHSKAPPRIETQAHPRIETQAHPRIETQAHPRIETQAPPRIETQAPPTSETQAPNAERHKPNTETQA